MRGTPGPWVWTESDKQLHFIAGCLASAWGYGCVWWRLKVGGGGGEGAKGGARAVGAGAAAGICVALAAGVAKEVYDGLVKDWDYVSHRDIVATVVGGLAASLVIAAAHSFCLYRHNRESTQTQSRMDL